MIRGYLKVKEITTNDTCTWVTFEALQDGFVHNTNDVFAPTKITNTNYVFSIAFAKGFEHEFAIDTVAMVDYFKVPPKGWAK